MASVIPWEVVPAVKVQEIAQFHTETDPTCPALYTAVFLLAMNQAKYDGLPPELRAVIDRNTALALSGQAGRLWDEQKPPGAQARARSRQHRAISFPPRELAQLARRSAAACSPTGCATWTSAASTARLLADARA